MKSKALTLRESSKNWLTSGKIELREILEKIFRKIQQLVFSLKLILPSLEYVFVGSDFARARPKSASFSSPL